MMDLPESLVRVRQKQHRHRHTYTHTHTPSTRIEMKILDSAGNRSWAAGEEVRDSTDLVTATDIIRIEHH